MRALHSMLGIWLLGTCACTGETVSIGSDQQAGLDAGFDAAVEHAAPETSMSSDTSLLLETGTEASWPEPFGACGHLIGETCEPPANESLAPHVLFDSAVLGPGHRIVDADGQRVWIDREQGGVHDTLLMVATDFNPNPVYEQHTLASEVPLQPVAADGVTVLACSATGCSLWAWDSQQPQVQRLEGAELPIDTKPFAIAANADRVHVLGDGVYRFEAGVWTTEIAPETGVRWRAIADHGFVGGDHNTVVVGDHGAVRVRKDPGPWEVLETGLQASLLAVSMRVSQYGDSILIGAEDGTLTRIEDGQTHTCSIGSGISSIWHHPAAYSVQAAGSTIDGRGFVFERYHSGCFAPTPASGVIKTRVFLCGIASNVLYLTDTVLYGTNFCAVD